MFSFANNIDNRRFDETAVRRTERTAVRRTVPAEGRNAASRRRAATRRIGDGISVKITVRLNLSLTVKQQLNVPK